MDPIEATRDYYNKQANVWANQKTHSFYHQTQFEKFVNLFKEGDEIIDIGCSWGIHVPLFLGIGRKLKYMGIDISDSFLNLARSRFPQLTFGYGNIIEEATLPKDKFDGFLAVATLMHIPYENWPVMFANIQNMMKPGAIGYISLPVEHPSGERASEDPRHFTLIDEDSQVKELTEKRWQIIDRGTLSGYSVNNAWRWYLVKLPE